MIVIFSFLVFLFVLYLLSREDFVFLRRNVSLQQIFDICFVVSGAGLLIARLVYVGFHPRIGYLNPLVFFLVPYFPGLALSGALLGGVLCLFALTQRKKFPTGRILDVFSLSFFFSFAIYFCIRSILQLTTHQLISGGIDLGIGLLSLLLSFMLVRIFYASVWRDGSVALWIFSFVGLLNLVEKALLLLTAKKFVIEGETIAFAVLCLVVVGIAIQRQLSNGRGVAK